MFLPRYLISSVLALYRAPWQVGTRCVDARQEQQLDHDEPLALARLAAAFGDVEREPPGVVVPGPRLFGRGEQLADMVEQPGVGRQVRPRRAADRLLVHPHQPLDASMPPAIRPPCVTTAAPLQLLALLLVGRQLVAELLGHQLDQRLADQARLARSRTPRSRW